MKPIPTLILTLALASRVSALAADASAPGTPAAEATNAAPTNPEVATTPAAPVPDASTNTTALPAAATEPSTNAAAPGADTSTTNAPASDVSDTNATGGIRLNFRGASLDAVLDHLSDAAGFIINKETDVRGRVDVWSKTPLTKEEAVDLLNAVLSKNGYGVIRNGRLLTIVSRDSIKARDLPVKHNRKLEDIDKNEEIVTEIIPVRHATASQLVKDLEQLLPTTAVLTANESANSLVLTDTQTDVRRMVEIVRALDDSISSVSAIHVFRLNYADAKELASVIKDLFATPASSQGGANAGGRGQFFNMFRGGGAAAAAAAAGGGANANLAKVTAVADDRSNSLIVSAPQDMMSTIVDMVEQIDQPVSDLVEVRLFHLNNADPYELVDQFTQLFPDDSKSDQNQNQGFRFGGGPFGRGAAASSTAGGSDRLKKKGRVVAVADPRTSSVIVSASSELMPEISRIVQQLDVASPKKERVLVMDMQYADPYDVQQVLQDLFNRNTTMRNNNRSATLQNNPLTMRQQQQQQTTSSAVTGSMGGSRGGGVGGGTGF